MVIFAFVVVDDRRVRITVNRLLLLGLTQNIIGVNGASNETFVSNLIPVSNLK